MLLLAIALASLIGVALGLLGGGGSILAVTILRYVLGLPGHQAIALSLLVVAATSSAALAHCALRGRVRWRTGVLFGLAGMVAAFAAGRIAHLVPAVALLVAFGLVMFATGFAMLRRATCTAAPAPAQEPPIAKVLAEGLAIGAITGLLGAGGGFLIVPALVLLGGLPIELAIGTSLLVIAMQSLAGLAGYLGHTEIDWTLGLSISAAAVAGSAVGGAFARRLCGATLRAAFGWFVIAMALFVLAQELPAVLGGRPIPGLSLLAALAGTSLLALGRRLHAGARAPSA